MSNFNNDKSFSVEHWVWDLLEKKHEIDQSVPANAVGFTVKINSAVFLLIGDVMGTPGYNKHPLLEGSTIGVLDITDGKMVYNIMHRGDQHSKNLTTRLIDVKKSSDLDIFAMSKILIKAISGLDEEGMRNFSSRLSRYLPEMASELLAGATHQAIDSATPPTNNDKNTFYRL